ncbi:hypothetical protein AAG570_003191 [Ranatra chinensis]|uniref:Uncharacterized protein n=1 Tax=Ranatra chinensis TaxID=642074 RepID=A0ABD0Y644_9HEMI
MLKLAVVLVCLAVVVTMAKGDCSKCQGSRDECCLRGPDGVSCQPTRTSGQSCIKGVRYNQKEYEGMCPCGRGMTCFQGFASSQPTCQYIAIDPTHPPPPQ